MLYNPHFTVLYKTLETMWSRWSDDLALIKVTWKPVKNHLGDVVQYLPDIEIKSRGCRI